MGRGAIIKPREHDAIVAMLRAGETRETVAAHFGRWIGTIAGIARAYGIKPPKVVV